MPKAPNPAAPLNHVRTPISRGLKASTKPAERIDRKGGDYGAGVIYGVSVITRGEALGHRMWIDGTMVEQVHDAIDAAGETGMKARFTHPGLSADGLGSYLGRLKNSEFTGDQTFADLHIAKAARKAPDGDLGGYVMDLAENDPDQFGLSIVFTADRLSEERFELDNSTADDEGEPRFKSPDEQNVNNYRHARLAKLHGADAVDEPAANPTGMFSRHQDLAAEADALLSYALLDGERPELHQLSVDPDRLTAFVHRFCDRHRLTISKEETPAMSTTPATTAAPAAAPALSAGTAAADSGAGSAAATPAGTVSQSAGQAGDAPKVKQFTADELKNWKEQFGAENAIAFLSEGISETEAQKRYNAQLREQLGAAEQKAKELETRLAQSKTGEETPLGAGKDDSGGKATAGSAGSDNYAAATAAIAARMPTGK